MTKVKDEVRKLGVNVADSEYERTHRVARKTDAWGNVVDCRQMMFGSQRGGQETEVYRSRDKHSGHPFLYLPDEMEILSQKNGCRICER